MSKKTGDVKKLSIVGKSGKAAALRTFLAKYPFEATQACVTFCRYDRPEVEISQRVHSVYHHRKEEDTRRVNIEDIFIVVEMPVGHELKYTYVAIYDLKRGQDRGRCAGMTKYCVKEIIFPDCAQTKGLFRQEREQKPGYKKEKGVMIYQNPDFFKPNNS